jgi:hypothetical protein
MQPLNDDNLDRLSREAADQFEIDAGAFGWERLEKRLTQELPEQEKDRRRFLFWMFFIVLVTGGGLAMMLGNGKKTAAIDQNTMAVSTGTTPSGPHETASPDAATANTASAAKAAAPVGGNNNQGTNDKVQETRLKTQDPKNKIQETGNPPLQNAGGQSQQPEAAGIPSAADRVPPSASAAAQGLPPAKQYPATRLRNTSNKNQGTRHKLQGTSNNEQGTGYKAQGNRNQQPETTNQQPETSNRNPVTSSQQPVPSTQQPATDTAVKTLTVDPVVETIDSAAGKVAKKTPAPKQKNKVPSPWEIGLVFGPDLTYVKFYDSYKTGYNVGLQIGYRLSNRWAVNTGLFYTKKNYAANGEDFNAPAHSWISYQDLRQVKGNCSMFEIPLNVRYDLIANKTNRFFASTGLTSYIMTKQAYDYYYYNRNNEFKVEPWGSGTTSRYFFSVVNLSAGYEQNISKQFSIQAEPYLKLPLKGLGYGTMRMESFGLYLSVKYKPFFRK